jgi:hypothetical protein
MAPWSRVLYNFHRGDFEKGRSSHSFDFCPYLPCAICSLDLGLVSSAFLRFVVAKVGHRRAISCRQRGRRACSQRFSPRRDERPMGKPEQKRKNNMARHNRPWPAHWHNQLLCDGQRVPRTTSSPGLYTSSWAVAFFSVPFLLYDFIAKRTPNFLNSFLNRGQRFQKFPPVSSVKCPFQQNSPYTRSNRPHVCCEIS